MADPPTNPDAGDDAPGMPRWVKVFVVVGILVALLAVALMVFGGGQHGPTRHLPPVYGAGPDPSGNDLSLQQTDLASLQPGRPACRTTATAVDVTGVAMASRAHAEQG